MAHITDITVIFIKEGFLVTMDIERGFSSLEHTFIISVLKKIGFGNNFVSWIETSNSKQKSCVIVVILLSIFILKGGLAKVTLSRFISLCLP